MKKKLLLVLILLIFNINIVNAKTMDGPTSANIAANLPANVAVKDANNNFSVGQTISGNTVVLGNVAIGTTNVSTGFEVSPRTRIKANTGTTMFEVHATGGNSWFDVGVGGSAVTRVASGGGSLVVGPDATQQQGARATIFGGLYVSGNITSNATINTSGTVSASALVVNGDIIGNAKLIYNDTSIADTSMVGEFDYVSINAVVAFGTPIGINSFGGYITANATVSTNAICQALAFEVGTGSHKVLKRGTVRNDSWTWVAGPIYLSTTGTLTQTKPSASGNVVQYLGWAESATIMRFEPQYVTVVIL